MNKRTHIVFTLISLSIILSLSFNLNASFQIQAITDLESGNIDDLNYTISGPILINEEIDFTNLGFSGSGINGDPYKIEELKIETSNSYGIQISGVSSYFTIEDCYIDAEQYAINIEGPVAGQVQIENNTLVNTNHGIYINNLDDLEVVNNTIQNCGQYSARIYFSDGMKIINNTFIGSEQVYLANAQSAIIENNTCIDTGFNIYTNGAWFQNHVVTNNYVNGKPLGFFVNPQDLVISDNIYGQIIIGDGDNVTVRDQVIGNTATSIISVEVNGLNLFNNTCLNNYLYGIRVIGRNTLIEDCEVGFVSPYGAIDVSTSAHTIIRNCYLHDSSFGVIAVNSPNITCFNNTIENNSEYGIRYQSNAVGNVYNNTISNSGQGLRFHSFDLTTIAYNIFENSPSGFYGINFDSGCNNNTIHNNFFLNNNPGGISEALDEGFNNTWFDESTLTGNYYSDYSGSGDYVIEGSAGSVDPYVIVDTTSPVIVVKAVDLDYTEGETGNTIYWQASEQYPRFYQQMLNGSIFRTAVWRSFDIINLNVDGLDAGVHNYTTVFFDIAGNSIASTIIVTVIAVIPEYQQTSILLVSLSIISIISISYIIKRKK
ncbi:MAG: hypothetical protein GOP50_10420 [Candidatus Heimdallarchaeota archaeon]|nr:hypothetical protein [Candidatus Heimdallarchaeota archaeon]